MSSSEAGVPRGTRLPEEVKGVTLPSCEARMIEEIAQRYGLELIILFGSRAKGNPHAESDCDVAVKAGESFPLEESERLRWETALEEELAVVLAVPEGLDLVVLNEAPSLLAYEVARSGRPLYERDSLVFRRFQSSAYLRYFDDERLYLKRKAYLKERIHAR